MGLQNIRAVIFDFDGTLAVLNIDFAFMKERIFDLMGHFDVKEEGVSERYLLEIIDEVYPILWRKNPSDAADFYEKAHQILHEVEMEAAAGGRLISGVEKALKDLRGQGIKVGIVTRNCEEAVREAFPAIDDYCDVFIPRNSVKKVKPHPDHLTSALKALGIGGEEAVMVGDHLIDIQAGKRAGMKTIGVLTGRITREEFERVGADYVLEDATEVPALLKAERSEV
jgi:phosphoglycolate phosphatase